jgi:hypothetical protein
MFAAVALAVQISAHCPLLKYSHLQKAAHLQHMRSFIIGSGKTNDGDSGLGPA